MFKAKGKIFYDTKTDKSKFREWWCQVSIHQSLSEYYRWWVKKELGIYINLPIWRGHCTIVRGETPKNLKAWNKYQGEVVEFEYSEEIRWSELYFWLPVYSRRFEEIRMELGLSPRPRVNFHFTLGNLKGLNPPKAKRIPFKTFIWERPEYFKL